MFQRNRPLTLSSVEQNNSRNNSLYTIYELTTGKMKLTGSFKETTTVNLSSLQAGTYLVRIGEHMRAK